MYGGCVRFPNPLLMPTTETWGCDEALVGIQNTVGDLNEIVAMKTSNV